MAQFDSTVRAGLESILNVELSDTHWLQATLPVREGGLGVRSLVSLAPSAFLASAVSMHSLQDEILPQMSSCPDTDFISCADSWSQLVDCTPLTDPGAEKQRSWDTRIVAVMKQHLLSLCQSDLDKAKILAVSAPHAGDWLHAIPLDNCDPLLENEELRIAVGIRIGAPVCLPHECVCGSMVDKLGLHFFPAKSSEVSTQGTAY